MNEGAVAVSIPKSGMTSTAPLAIPPRKLQRRSTEGQPIRHHVHSRSHGEHEEDEEKVPFEGVHRRGSKDDLSLLSRDEPDDNLSYPPANSEHTGLTGMMNRFNKANKELKQKQRADSVNNSLVKSALSGAVKAELARRTTANLLKAIKPRRMGKLYEQFLIVGYPVDAKITKKSAKKRRDPEILYQYPPDVPVDEQIVHFCFPRGVRPSVLKSTGKARVVVFGTSSLENANHSFVFIITTSENHFLYGICVVQNESLTCANNLESHFHFPRTRKPCEHDPSLNIYAPRAYCIISRFPFFQLHFNVLYSIVEAERQLNLMHAERNIARPRAGISKAQSTFDLPTTLAHQEEDTIEMKVNRVHRPVFKAKSTSNLARDNVVMRFLAEYHCDASALQSLTLELPGAKTETFNCPRGDEVKLIAEWCLATTLRLFSLKDIMLILRALKLECSILVVCRSLGLLSAVCISFIPLLSPYIWEGPFIPILPEHLEECIESPVPFIIGVPSLPTKREAAISNCLVLDLKASEAGLPSSPLPPLPGEKELMEQLKRYHSQFYHPDASEEEKHDMFQHFTRASKAELEAVNGVVTELRDHQLRVETLRVFYSDLVVISNAVPDTEKAIKEAQEEGREKRMLLRLKKTKSQLKSIPAHPSQFPNLVESDCLNYDDPDQIEKLVHIYPLSDQEAMRNVLHTQSFAVFLEKSKTKQVRGKSSFLPNFMMPDDVEGNGEEPTESGANENNANNNNNGDGDGDECKENETPTVVHVTVDSAREFVTRLIQMTDEEAKQTMMLADLARIYETEGLELQKLKEEQQEQQHKHHQQQQQHHQQQNSNSTPSTRRWTMVGSGSFRKKRDSPDVTKKGEGEGSAIHSDEKMKKEELDHEAQKKDVFDSLARSQVRLRTLQTAKNNLEELLNQLEEHS